MPYQVSMMGWVGSGGDFCGLGWVQKFWVGLGFEKLTHDQLCCAPPLRRALYKKWGGTIKNFFRCFAPDGYVPHHFHIRSGALGYTAGGRPTTIIVGTRVVSGALLQTLGFYH